MKKTKIDWCDSTINCVYGCPNNCEYCYGKVMNNRFHLCKDWCKPEWRPDHLKDFYGKKPKSIFIDSMSDIGTWKIEWLAAVMRAMFDNIHHRYILLTKCKLKDLGYNFEKALKRLGYPKVTQQVIWTGKTVTNQMQMDALLEEMKIEDDVDFLSIEPIHGPINLSPLMHPHTSLIIGAETGNRKGKVIPQKEWIDSLVEQADRHGHIVFMKESLRKIMGADFRQDRLPWEIEK